MITDLEAITGTAPEVPARPRSAVPKITAINAQTQQMMAVVAEQFRLVWNARGEADMRELAEPVVSTIVDALRRLDR